MRLLILFAIVPFIVLTNAHRHSAFRGGLESGSFLEVPQPASNALMADESFVEMGPREQDGSFAQMNDNDDEESYPEPGDDGDSFAQMNEDDELGDDGDSFAQMNEDDEESYSSYAELRDDGDSFAQMNDDDEASYAQLAELPADENDGSFVEVDGDSFIALNDASIIEPSFVATNDNQHLIGV